MNLNFDFKRALLAVLIIVIGIGLIAGLIWLLFFRTIAPPPGGVADIISPGGELPGTGMGQPNIIIPGIGGLPIEPGTIPGREIGPDQTEFDQVARGGATAAGILVGERVESVVMDSRGFNYLSGEDDKFYRISAEDGQRFLLSDRSFPHVDKTTWSPDGSKVILKYPDGANVIYDFNKNQQITLPAGMEEPSFKSNSDEIAFKYIGNTAEENWLAVSAANGSGIRAIEPIGLEGGKVQPNWSPANQVIATYRKPTGLNSEQIYFIGLNDENFRALTVQGSGFTGLWSPQGARILYHTISANNNYNPSLWIADAYGDNIGFNNFNLGLTTWVDKCAFTADGRTVYCAVPITLGEGAGIYPDLVNDQPDVFYQIDLLFLN